MFGEAFYEQHVFGTRESLPSFLLQHCLWLRIITDLLREKPRGDTNGSIKKAGKWALLESQPLPSICFLLIACKSPIGHDAKESMVCMEMLFQFCIQKVSGRGLGKIVMQNSRQPLLANVYKVVLDQWWQIYGTHVKGDVPQIWGSVPAFTNTQKLFLKAHPVLAKFL